MSSGKRFNKQYPEDYEDITDESTIVETSPIFKFQIKYPLSNPAIFELVHKDGTGWTAFQMIKAVMKAYKAVYEEEGEDPGTVPGLLNRAKSNGKYGIWGHITDLVLEGARKDGDTWKLFVGS
jgi:hypothetical protein